MNKFQKNPNKNKMKTYFTEINWLLLKSKHEYLINNKILNDF